MWRTPDQIAAELIAEGRRQNITERGIVGAIACGLVETNLVVYANRKVPESMRLPHDAVGSDGYSVGPLQQQVRKGLTGDWWWGDAKTCMDPTTAARLFYQRLTRLPYNDRGRSMGSFVQDVQQSAYPDRYEKRMAQAQQIYDRLSRQAGDTSMAPDYGITKTMHGYNPTTGPDCTGNSNGPREQTLYVVFHTQQSRSTAVNLANFCNNSWNTPNPVSYNLAVDDVDTIEIVPIGEGPWAAADANNIAVHICFAGSFAEWKRSKWLETDDSDGVNESAMLSRGAKAAAAAIAQYGIPNVKVRVANGWPADPKGLAGHRDFGARGGGHTDPGPDSEFPWQELINRITQYLTNEEGDLDMASVADINKKLDLLLDQMGPKLQAWGEPSSFGVDENGDERTLRDGVIALFADLQAQINDIRKQVTK